MTKRTGMDSIGFRQYIQALMLIVIAFAASSCGVADEKPMFVPKKLAFEEKALEPTISERTMRLHYGKHYAGYIKSADRYVKKSRFKGQTMAHIIQATGKEDQYAQIFNQVAQAWNHEFWFESIKPEGGGLPTGILADKIGLDFGGFKRFRAEFADAAEGLFASGWVWLVLENDRLDIVTTANADTPLARGLTPLFVIDVWEHAYYLDYENRRREYVEAVIAHCADWDRVASRLERSLATVAGNHLK